MRAHTPARLIWFLLAALLGALPHQSASGAVLTWTRAADHERLLFSFSSSLPVAEPRQRGLTRIIIPISADFWANEAKPKIPNFTASALIKGVSVTDDGILIDTRNGDFIFSSAAHPALQELNVILYPPPTQAPPPPQNATPATEPAALDGTNSSAETPANASTPGNETAPFPAVQEEGRDAAPTADVNATKPGDDIAMDGNATGGSPQDSLSGTASLRGRISRPATPPDQAETAAPGQREAGLDAAAEPKSRDTFRLRMPVERNATAPLPQTEPEAAAEETPTEHATGPGPDAAEGHAADNATSAQALPADAPHAITARPDHETQEAGAPDGNATSSAQETRHKPAPDSAHDAEATNASASHDEPGNATDADAPAQEAAMTVNASSETPTAVTGNMTEDNSTAELEALYRLAQVAVAAGDLPASRQAITAMIEHPKVPEALREELLYNLADITMQQGKGDFAGNYTAILDAYQTAMYANPASPNMPEALYRIGFLQLAVGNLPEAKGNFDLLRRKYPDNPRVAMIDTFWGDHFLREKKFAKAAEHYRYVIENFPMSPAVKPANVGLLKAYTELGFFDKAMDIVNTIEKRWPRYYLEDPSFLMAAGYAAMLSGNDDRARDFFWTYVNIVPDAPDADVAMARIGDIHLKQNKPNAARELYHRTAEAFPDREGGLIAQMRLAEEGVLDKPSIGDMAPVFDRPNANPEEIYTRILEHADSPLAPIARLKLAMWRLWKGKFPESLEDVRRFEQDYPEHELLPKAREVADKALRDWIMRDLEQGNFEGIVQNWSDHQDLYTDREPDPQTRLVVATAMMRTGRSREALEMAKPFVFGSIPRGEHSEPGMDLTLAMLVELQEWKDILELARRVAPWNLNAERRRQVDYAAALANEKLNQAGMAKPLWDRLATDLGLTDTQRGYAHYFLGRAALAAGEFERATILGQEALELLKKEKDDIPKLKETLELLVQAAERRGRNQEALAWSLEYDGYVTPEDRDWPAHTYRKAVLFRRNDDMKRWRETLLGLKERFPNTLYGRMAAAELEGVRIEREVEKFR